MYLQELSLVLSQFDKRTIELLLTRSEKNPPPPHLSDLGIAALMETSGRERRHRYYTIAAYQALVAKENLDETASSYATVNFASVGGFLSVDPNMFYQDEASLFRYQDEFKEADKGGSKNPPKNPILSDGSIKQGRPRKYPINEDGMVVLGNGKLRRVTYKRKRELTAADEAAATKRIRIDPGEPQGSTVPETDGKCFSFCTTSLAHPSL